MFSFDAIQIRYAGSHLQEVFAAVGSGQILPVSITFPAPYVLRRLYLIS